MNELKFVKIPEETNQLLNNYKSQFRIAKTKMMVFGLYKRLVKQKITSELISQYFTDYRNIKNTVPDQIPITPKMRDLLSDHIYQLKTNQVKALESEIRSSIIVDFFNSKPFDEVYCSNEKAVQIALYFNENIAKQVYKCRDDYNVAIQLLVLDALLTYKPWSAFFEPLPHLPTKKIKITILFPFKLYWLFKSASIAISPAAEYAVHQYLNFE